MSWELLQENSNTLYCKTLFCDTVACDNIELPDDSKSNVLSSYYTNNGATYIQQKANVTIYYRVTDLVMNIHFSSNGQWTIQPNVSGTGWSVLKVANWNGGAPLGLSIPYKLDCDDNIYACIIPCTINSVTYAIKISVNSGTSGSWTITMAPTGTLTEFPNNGTFSQNNFNLTFPVLPIF